MDLHLKDRAFVVTGGSRGVGRAVVQALLGEGAAVATCGRDAETLDNAYPDNRERLLLRAVEVRDPGATEEFVETAAAEFGRLDGAVAAAGAGAPDSLATVTALEMTDQFAIKVHPILNLVQAVRPRMPGGGSIVVIGGITAHAPHRHMVAASAGQAAARNLTVNLAAELAPAIRINTVALGPIEGRPQDELFRADPRDLTYAEWKEDQVLRRGILLGRFGTPQDVAPTVLLLLSPLSAFTTGASVLVSGGLGMRP